MLQCFCTAGAIVDLKSGFNRQKLVDMNEWVMVGRTDSNPNRKDQKKQKKN